MKKQEMFHFPLNALGFNEKWVVNAEKESKEASASTYLVSPSKASGWIVLILLSYNVNRVT